MVWFWLMTSFILYSLDHTLVLSLTLKGFGWIVMPLVYSWGTYFHQKINLKKFLTSEGGCPSSSGSMENCWTIPVKKRNSSVLARVSPRHCRRPAREQITVYRRYFTDGEGDEVVVFLASSLSVQKALRPEGGAVSPIVTLRVCKMSYFSAQNGRLGQLSSRYTHTN